MSEGFREDIDVEEEQEEAAQAKRIALEIQNSSDDEDRMCIYIK